MRKRSQKRGGSSALRKRPTLVLTKPVGGSNTTVPVFVRAAVLSRTPVTGRHLVLSPAQYSQTAIAGGLSVVGVPWLRLLASSVVLDEKGALIPFPCSIRSAVKA